MHYKTPDDLRVAFTQRHTLEPAPYGLAQPCRVWSGHLEDGYGYMQVLGHSVRVHRLAFALFVGPIPPGADVLHRCDRRACIEPTHLWAGFRGDNNRDCLAKGRHRAGSLFRAGTAHPNARLTEEIVRAIRAAPPGAWKPVAVGFGISAEYARDIRRRKNWKHVS